MGKIKNSDNGKHKLTEREFNYLNLLNSALTFNTFKDRIISGFLYHVCKTRFGYNDDVNLMFEIDLDSKDMELFVKEVPNQDLTSKA